MVIQLHEIAGTVISNFKTHCGPSALVYICVYHMHFISDLKYEMCLPPSLHISYEMYMSVTECYSASDDVLHVWCVIYKAQSLMKIHKHIYTSRLEYTVYNIQWCDAFDRINNITLIPIITNLVCYVWWCPGLSWDIFWHHYKTTRIIMEVKVLKVPARAPST